MLIPFSPPPGLNSDDTSFAAEGRWTDGNNVRFYNGKPQVIGGTSDLFTVTGFVACRCIFPFVRAGAVMIAYGGDVSADGKLYVGTGLGTPANRSPAGLVGSRKNWSFAAWGDTLLACPEADTLYQQSGTGAATAVATAPALITYMLATNERQILAFGCSEEVSGTFNALCIRGSDLEDYTDWTTSPTNNAFEHILPDGGAIVAARCIGAYIAVWTTSSLYLGQFLGDPGQAYRFDKVDENCGLIGPNAVIVFNGIVYWMGVDSRIRSWAPGSLPKIMPCAISRDFRSASNFDPTLQGRYVAASANSAFNEIRFDYSYIPDTCWAFIAVCLDDGSWHRGIGGRTAIVDDPLLSSLTAGILGGPTIISAAGGTGQVAMQDTGPFTWSNSGASSVLAPYIQSAAQTLENSGRRLLVRSVEPDFEGQVNDLKLTLFVRDRPQSTPLTKGPYTLTTTTTKLGCRCSGKLIEVKIGSVSESAAFRVGKLLFDVEPMGNR